VKKLLAVAMAVLFIAGCDSKPDAPFGFKWGQTVKQTLSQNLKDAKVSGNEDTLIFISAHSAPQPVPYSGWYRLVFTPGVGLTSASFSTPVDEGGFFFNEGRNVYSSISKKLEEKYGPPQNVNESMARDGAEFYSCIKEDGCGKWERTYQHDGVKIKLSVRPTPGKLMDGLSKAYIGVDYEYYTEKMKKESLEKSEKKYSSNNF